MIRTGACACELCGVGEKPDPAIWKPAMIGVVRELSATACQGILARATICGFWLMDAKVLSSRRIISLSRRRAVRPPITTPTIWAPLRTTDDTRLNPDAPV